MKKWLVAVMIFILILGFCPTVLATDGMDLFETPESTSSSLQIILMLTVLSLAPSILIMMTGFTRIIIVLSFVRNAMGTQNTPPNQVLVGLALFLTFFVMAPVISQINDVAYKPYMAQEITQEEAYSKAMTPLRDFMGRQVKEKDLALFMSMAKLEPVETFDDIPTHVLIPAFITSEIKTAFQIGFFIFIPFLIIDMIVSSTLMSMGMMMLPPVTISLPFKILLFLVVDGWGMTMQSLITSFH